MLVDVLDAQRVDDEGKAIHLLIGLLEVDDFGLPFQFGQEVEVGFGRRFRARRAEGGQHTFNDGRRGAGGVTITDGPYAEAKDIVGGYYVIEATDASEAQAIAEGCPHVENGWIEIRTVEIG